MPNKSELIRRMADAGLPVKEICKVLNIRYQFAYNVVLHHAEQKRKAAAQ